MQLNDAANDTDRQRLMPFVTRLACADTPKVERERELVIRSHMREFDYGFLGGTRFENGLEALEAALATGRQAEPPLFAEVAGRMEAARNAPAAPVLKRPRGLSSKLKGWFTASTKADAVS